MVRTARGLLALLAVLYLCAAGWFFILAPWSSFWAALVVPHGPIWLLPVLDSPAVRGALTAFGVLHFITAFCWLAPRDSNQ